MDIHYFFIGLLLLIMVITQVVMSYLIRFLNSPWVKRYREFRSVGYTDVEAQEQMKRFDDLGNLK